LMTVGGGKYAVELVKVHESWPRGSGHHGYQK